jgi:hypothetical protein
MRIVTTTVAVFRSDGGTGEIVAGSDVGVWLS